MPYLSWQKETVNLKKNQIVDLKVQKEKNNKNEQSEICSCNCIFKKDKQKEGNNEIKLKILKIEKTMKLKVGSLKKQILKQTDQEK